MCLTGIKKLLLPLTMKDLKFHNMKNIFFSIFLLSLLLSQSHSYAQLTSGKVTYEATLSKQKELPYDSIKASDKVKQNVKKLFNNKNKLYYVLKFKHDNSIFLKKEQLELRKNLLLNAYVNSGTYYHNRKQQVILYKGQYENNLFISYPIPKWILTNETKIIHGYSCGKATTTFKVLTSKGETLRTAIAWYAFDLPYNFGPSEFSGLPGLIIELNFIGKYRIRATKIELNSKNIHVAPPSKGKIISRDDYAKKLKKIYNQRMKKYKS